MSALYRHIGFSAVSERGVPAEGRQFERRITKNGGAAEARSAVSDETWRIVVNRVLESPKLPNQAAKPFLQLTPVVPDIALYSGSARRAGNSWPAGALIERLVVMGSSSADHALIVWQKLFEALSVDSDDDMWAQWLADEFAKRRISSHRWAFVRLKTGFSSDLTEISMPAQQFVRDLWAVLEAKQMMTRAQWVSLLGAVLRIGAVMHVIWLCDVHDRIWRFLRRALIDGTARDASVFVQEVFPKQLHYFEYGKAAVPVVRDFVNRYLTARLGINSLLWHLGDAESLQAPLAVHRLAQKAVNQRADLQRTGLLDRFALLQEREARTLSCKKGIGSNVVEFARHVLGQRQSQTEVLRGYDQAYFLKKQGIHTSAPWAVSFGPVSIISLVHCCMHRSAGPRSVHRLAQHVGAYGIHIGMDDLSAGDLGSKLRLLGLVLDSPDAETGMLLTPPFAAVPEGTSA